MWGMSVPGDAVIGDVPKHVVVLEVGRLLEGGTDLAVEIVDEGDVVRVECFLMGLRACPKNVYLAGESA